MPSESRIPEGIKKYRPCKCSKIRNDNGIYRVYKYKAVKLPSGKWGTDQGYLIGKIIPGEGFCPNKRYLKETAQSDSNESVISNDNITDAAYGQYALLIKLSEDIINGLKECFPFEKAMQIYSYGLILCIWGFVPIDQIGEFYRESFLSVLHEHYTFKMESDAISSLLRDLGMHGEPVRKFEQKLIDSSSGNIAVDGHGIRSCPNENDPAEAGYKPDHRIEPQISILTAYDINRKIPLIYQTCAGADFDKQIVPELLESRSFKDVKFIVAKGFVSDIVLERMSRDNNCYIAALPPYDRNYKRIKKSLEYSSGEFLYSPDAKETSRIIYYEEQLNEKLRIIVYKDIDENNASRKSYRLRLDSGEDGYTQGEYDECCDWWGYIFSRPQRMKQLPKYIQTIKDVGPQKSARTA